MLLDPETGIVKLCDFGSAKHLVKGEPNVSYICSRNVFLETSEILLDLFSLFIIQGCIFFTSPRQGVGKNQRVYSSIEEESGKGEN